MSIYHCDYQQVRQSGVTVEDTDGTKIDTEGFIIPVIIPASAVPELLANYDPSSGTSPLVATARPLARVILDALRRKEQENP